MVVMARRLLIIAVLFLPATLSVFAQAEPVLAVFPFSGGQDIEWYVRESFLESLTNELVNKIAAEGSFRVVERSRLEESLGEIMFGQTELVDVNQAVQMGRIVGASVAVYPALRRVQTSSMGGFSVGGISVSATTVTVHMSARLVSTESGEILGSVQATGRDTGASIDIKRPGWSFDSSEFKDSALGRAIDRALDQLVREMPALVPAAPAELTAVLVQVDPIAVIDRGTAHGVRPGMTFAIRKVIEVEGLSDPLRVTVGEATVVEADAHASVVEIEVTRPGYAILPGDELTASLAN